MKTIEERVKDYSSKAWRELDEEHVSFENIVREAFIAGAESERAELLCWHIPKMEHPDDYKPVLIKYYNAGRNSYAVAYLFYKR